MTYDASLPSALLDRFRLERRQAHTRVLAPIEDLTEEQLRWRPGAHAPGIGFHVWHLARWEDYDRSLIEDTPQIWLAQDLARAWGFTPHGLGEADTGTDMGDDASERLALPDKEALLDYAHSSFAGVDELLDRLAAESLLKPIESPEHGNRVINLLYDSLTHANRHLGMIEAVRGLLGLRGTATR